VKVFWAVCLVPGLVCAWIGWLGRGAPSGVLLQIPLGDYWFSRGFGMFSAWFRLVLASLLFWAGRNSFQSGENVPRGARARLPGCSWMGLGKGQVKDCVSRRIFTLYGGSRRGGRVGIAPSQHQFVFSG